MYAWGVWLSQMPGGRENGLPPGGTTQWLLSIRRGSVPRPCPTRIPKSADDFGILSRSSASVDVGPVDTTCQLDQILLPSRADSVFSIPVCCHTPDSDVLSVPEAGLDHPTDCVNMQFHKATENRSGLSSEISQEGGSISFHTLNPFCFQKNASKDDHEIALKIENIIKNHYYCF